MANLGFRQIFGSNFYNNFSIDDQDPTNNWYELVFTLNDFMNVEDEGEILGGLGLSNLANPAEQDFYYSGGDQEKAINVFYAMFLMIMQNQAENINADPTQKIFIAEQAPRLGVGSRAGQVQRSFLVSFFTESNIATIPDVDDL